MIIVFDQAGENIDSPRLAALLQKCRQDNRAAVCFIIGGADGITQSLRGRAKHVLAFGSATWPHQLVRIMLLEQLYRAVTILAGPLNYVGANPKVSLSCHLPQPSK